jgi:hypothetical protein
VTPRRGGALLRIALAVVSFVASLVALRTALRRLIGAMVAWLLAGMFFLAGTLLVLSATWRVLRDLLRRRRPRP